MRPLIRHVVKKLRQCVNLVVGAPAWNAFISFSNSGTHGAWFGRNTEPASSLDVWAAIRITLSPIGLIATGWNSIFLLEFLNETLSTHGVFN